MNREILFRGKRVDNKGWAEGLLTIMWGQYHIINPIDENTAYPIDFETVCQYTGLIDKNGSKIFEGDILNDIDHGTMKCIYLHGSFVWYKEDGFRIECMRYVPVIEVIGNIFDNPELLEDSIEERRDD